MERGINIIVYCLVVSGIIQIFSIFAFFGNAFSNTGGEAIPNMFDLMFGSGKTYYGYFIEWKRFDALTFLFALQILIIIVAFVGFIVSYNIKTNFDEDWKGVVVSIILTLLSTIASIISFWTLGITDINQNGRYDVKLGFGPIFYSILHIIVIIILLCGVFIGISSGSFQRSFKKPTKYKPSSIVSYYNSNKTNIATACDSSSTSKNKCNENEKIDLLLKYKKMLDDRIITQEEFDKKKTQIL